jgi:hypothetical protein
MSEIVFRIYLWWWDREKITIRNERGTNGYCADSYCNERMSYFLIKLSVVER